MAPLSRPRPEAALTALVGTAILVAVAAHYRLDRTLCAAWPSRTTGIGYGAAYLAAVLLLTYAWRRARDAWPLVLLVHALALCALPFLSSDPLMYAAVGRALSGGASASVPLRSALGVDHPFLIPLPPAWQLGTSAYGPLWNVLARGLGALAGDDLAFALRLHQATAAGALLLGALLVSRAVDAKERSLSFVLVALCPLGVIEATVGAHNDALLVPLVAGALLAWRRDRLPLAFVILAMGLFIKASMAIILGPALLAAALVYAGNRHRRTVILVVTGAGAVALLIGLSFLHDTPLDALAQLVDRPNVSYDHCTRSFECLPRVLFRFVLHAPMAAWATGIVFKLLSIGWLGYGALRTAEAPPEERPSWLARTLFVYFLVLHGWAQSWYLLPLLPTLPFLVKDDHYAPAIRLYLVTAVAYYALLLPLSCLTDQIAIAVSDLAEASLTVFPPLVLLLRGQRRLPS